MNAIRPCERKCADPPEGCGQWLHHSRFRTWTRRHSTVSTLTFSERCKACEQKQRNEKKNEDRPRAIIQQRAADRAAKAGVNREFFLDQMNYKSLIAPLTVLMLPGAFCQCCGHQFQNERDIQIEHIEPPRNARDWARLHARNLRFTCGSCNRTKSSKDFVQWLDDQEGARIANLEQPTTMQQAETQEPEPSPQSALL